MLHRKLVFLSAGIGFVVANLTLPHWVTRESFLMGTTLEIAVRADSRARGFQAIESAFERVRRVDDLLNDWKHDSELSRLNAAAPGRLLPVSVPLSDLLREITCWARETQGAFDPAIGALIDAWDFRGRGRRPTAEVLAQATARTGVFRYQLNVDDRTVIPPIKGSWIDAGGFGKGAALRAARIELLDAGVPAGVLDFGGQIVVFGDTAWSLSVAHPDHREMPTVRLLVREASVSTSSQSEHFIEPAGERFGHVLDPRSGIPVPAWGSVTVIHRDAMVADILSTALFVMGADAGMAWAEAHHIAALFVIAGPELSIRWTSPMQSYLAVSAPQSTGD